MQSRNTLKIPLSIQDDKLPLLSPPSNSLTTFRYDLQMGIVVSPLGIIKFSFDIMWSVDD